MSRSGTSENSATSSCSARSSVLRSHHRQVPVAKLRRRLDDAAADEVGVGVGEVGGDGEQPPDRDRLLFEHLASHLVAAFAVAAQLLGGLVDRQTAPIRDRDTRSASRATGCGGCRSARPCSRRRRRTRSCTLGTGWPSPSKPCIGMCTWPSSPAIPAAPRTTAPALDHPAAETGADDCRDRRATVTPSRRSTRSGRRARRRCHRCCTRRGFRVAISRALRTSNPHHSGRAKLVAPFDEITPSADAGPGVSRPTARTSARSMPVISRPVVERRGQRVESRRGPLRHPARNLDHPVDQEAPALVEHRHVVLRSAVVDADDHGPEVVHSPPFDRR